MILDILYKLPNSLGYLSSFLNSFGFRTVNILVVVVVVVLVVVEEEEEEEEE